MRKHENGLCDECDVFETVEHVLFKCSKYKHQRKSFRIIKNRPVSVRELLGKGLCARYPVGGGNTPEE